MPIQFDRLDAIRPQINVIAATIGCSAEDLATVIAFETAGTIDPGICNVYYPATRSATNKQYAKRWSDLTPDERFHVVAVGLIQFTRTGLVRSGHSLEFVAGMSTEAQLMLVADYLRPYAGRVATLADLYLSILWPRSVGKDDAYVLFRGPGMAYKQNLGLDTDHDGSVTRGEIVARIRRYQQHFTPCWVRGECHV